MMSGRTVEIAPHAGFCFGVTRAVQALEEAIQNASPNATVAMLGSIIHNEAYVQSLLARGVLILDEQEALKRAEESSKGNPLVLLVRAHGILQNTEKQLLDIAANNPSFTLLDCTCPFVKKIHRDRKSVV